MIVQPEGLADNAAAARQLRTTPTIGFTFYAAEDGIYDFQARYIEFGGGSGFELIDLDGAVPVLLNSGVSANMWVGQTIAPGSNWAPGTSVVPEWAQLTGDMSALSDPGFMVRAIQDGRASHTGWGLGQMEELLDTGGVGGVPGVHQGLRLDQVVDLYETANGSAGNSSLNNPFPGIDPPAGGVDQNYFAVEVTGYVALKQGYHQIGINCDDGAILRIGNVEVGRTLEGGTAATWRFMFYSG